MTEHEWVPFGLTSKERLKRQALVDGVPPWLHESLLTWIVRWCTEGRSYVNSTRALVIERETRVLLEPPNNLFGWKDLNLRARLERCDELEILRIADLICRQSQADAQELDSILLGGSSRWCVGVRHGHRGLVERVPAGVQDAVEHTISTAGQAGKELAEAWADVFGLNPDPSDGYRMAVKAVESAAIPVVCPTKTEATLGNVIGQMKQQGDWRPPFLREHPDSPTAEVLLGMLRTLWRGHYDRHGGATGVPSQVSKEEAEAAVLLAATLVYWFTSGAVRRRP